MLYDSLASSDLLAALLLAQSGAAKTAIGWVLVALALLLALLVVGRPSGRKLPDGEAPANTKRR